MNGERRRRQAPVVPAASVVLTERGVCRAMSADDLLEVSAIERSAYSFPWHRDVFADCLGAGYHCRVLQLPGGIGAYGILATGAEEAHVLNLCTRPEWHGRGLARRMLAHLFECARQDRAGTIFLEVRPSNGRAIALYESLGFREMGVRPGYYPCGFGKPREDAILMGRTLL